MLAATGWGNPSADPVVFLHGGGQSRRSWMGAADNVARAGYHAISLDLRGHGESGWASDGDYILDAYARDATCVIDALDRPVVLVGASRGGQAALVGGARRQDKVAMAVLMDVAPRIDDPGVDAIRAFLHRSLTGFASVDEAAEALAAYSRRPRTGSAKGLRRVMRERRGLLFWEWDPRTVSPEFLNPPSETVDMTAAAGSFRRPLILIKAGHASLVTDDAAAHFRALVPHLVVETAPSLHHMLSGESNDAFAVRLLHHLATAVGPPAPQLQA